MTSSCALKAADNFLVAGENPGKSACIGKLNMRQPSIHVRNLLETAVLQVQHSPDLNEDDVRWIQQFAAHLITELSVIKEPNLLYAPPEEESSVDQQGQVFDRVGSL